VEINFCDPTQTAKIEEQSCAPEASCGDGIQNQNELGVDCGGLCNPCQILEEHPPVIQEDPLIVDNHIDENKKPNPSIEKPLLIEEKSSSFKWLLIIVVLLLVGGTSIGAIRYYQIHKPEEHDEELVAYLVQSIYNSIPIQQIMQTLAEQGWEEEELKTIMEGVQFVLSNIELDPELGKVIDKLFSSGWTMIEAKHFVDNVAIEFLILEIKRHSFMSQTEIYGMLTNDGYQREIVEKALGRVYAPQQRQQLM